MANKHNDIFNKKVSKVPKKAKNKPSYYLVMILLILTFLGSILGGVAFVQNNVVSAATTTETIDLSLNPIAIYNEYGAYDITSGVSARTANENLKNFGINGFGDEYTFKLNYAGDYDIYLSFNSQSSATRYFLFITLNNYLTINSSDIINFNFNFDTVEEYDVYFLNSTDANENTHILNTTDNQYNNSLSGFQTNFNIIRFVIHGIQFDYDNVFYNFGITIDKITEVPDEPDEPAAPDEPVIPDNPTDSLYSMGIFEFANFRYKILTSNTSTSINKTWDYYVYKDTDLTENNFNNNYTTLPTKLGTIGYRDGVMFQGSFGYALDTIPNNLEFFLIRAYFGNLGLELNNNNTYFKTIYINAELDSIGEIGSISGSEPYTQFVFYFDDGTNLTFNNKDSTLNSIDISSKIGTNLIAIDFYNRSVTITGLQQFNSYYDSLINQAFQDGYDNGKSEGFKDGFNRGELNGYNKGYNEGVNAAGEYTFFSLFSSVIDVPIKAFTDLFNFEIFGQNMTNFFLALVTFAIIIKIIQLLL